MSDVQSRYPSALVTGAGSGIGKAVARAFSELGIRVHAVDRDGDRLQALQRECDVSVSTLDVRDTHALGELFATHDFDVVFNNAGILAGVGRYSDRPAAEVDETLDINLRAPMHIAHFALQGMVKRRRGHLFFTGSSSGRFPHPNCATYSASKAAISMFCDALRCDLLGTGVRVTEIAPGRVQTNLYDETFKDPAAVRKLYDGYRCIQPEDMAAMIVQALKLPDAVDVSRIELFPTDQVTGGSQIVSFE